MEGKGLEENSEKLFTLFSKKILLQFSQEKHELESKIRERFDEEYAIKKANLIKENELIKETTARKQQLDFEKKQTEQKIQNSMILKQQETELIKKYNQKSEEIDSQWKNEIEKLKEIFNKSLAEKEEDYRKKEVDEQKEIFFASEKAKEEYQNEVKSHYNELIDQYKSKVTEILENNEKKMEKMKLDLKKDKANFEMGVYKKFQKLLEQKEQDMKVLLTDRENQLLDYDHQRSKDFQAKTKKIESDRIGQEKELHKRYEKQINDIKEISKDQINSLLKQIETEKKEKNELQNHVNQLELKIRKLSHNMEMWKLEYHKKTMEKFKKLLFEIELNSKKEMEEFCRRQIQTYESHLLLELKQKDNELKMYEQRAALQRK